MHFEHNSAKAGHHQVPDAASQMKTSCGSKDCQVERFLKELPDQVQCMSSVTSANQDLLYIMGTNPVVTAATTVELTDILESGGACPIPLGSRQAWLDIQQESDICRQFITCKTVGQLPGRKDKNKTVLNKMLKRCKVRKGLIVSRKFDDRLMKETDRTFVPHLFLPSILSVMHIRLKHPPHTQLLRIFEKYFVAF